MPAAQAAASVASASASLTLVNSSPSGAPPKPSWVSATPVRPSGRVAVGSIMKLSCLVVRRSAALADALLKGVEQHGADDDGAGGEILPEDVDARQIEEIADQRDDHHPDDRPQDVALAAIEAGAADHHAGNDLEFPATRGIGLDGADARQQDVAGEGSSQADDHQAGDLDAIGADPGEHRNGAVGTDRVD